MSLELPLLVEPEWLEPRLQSPDLIVVDCSWYLPDAGRDAPAEYRAGHIPGSVYLDLSSDLADPDAPVRNTVATPEGLGVAFGRVGISNASRVVLYDRLGGYSAGRVWWTLRYAGHERAGLLNGGYQRWRRAGRPIATGPTRPRPVRFDPDPQKRWLVGKAEVMRIVREGGARIVDARERDRFAGSGIEPARRAGHIPGSVNVPYADNLEGEPPVFRSPDELRRRYRAAGVSFDEPVITTCGSGVTASLDAFALVLLGHAQVAVYDGSWAEWGNAEDTPVETGP